MEKQNKQYKELRKELAIALDSLLEEQTKRLEAATQEQLSDRDGDVELLVEAGLVRYLRDYGGLFHSEDIYEATSKGHKVYNKISGKNKAQQK